MAGEEMPVRIKFNFFDRLPVPQSPARTDKSRRNRPNERKHWIMRTIEFLDKRIQGICHELKKLSVRQKFETADWQYKAGSFLRPEQADADAAPWEPFDCRTMHWYGPDRHWWFRAEVTVPQQMEGRPLWMHVCTQIDEWDDAKNPQFLLFVDGTVTQGIDMNHRDVLLTRSAKAGQRCRLDLQSYTGTLHTEFNLIVDLREIDPEIEGLYYDLSVPLWAFPRLEPDGKARRDLERVLNEAINLLDLRTPYNDSFYRSVAAARQYLKQALYTDLAGQDEVIASCIGHTHIDVAWWWTVAQTREKVCRSFATVLKLMEEYPDYKFMSSQPQLYVFLKERYPELYDQIRQRVREGRWEPEGGMWLEADCNLTSGESLVRQFLYGKRFFREEFGIDSRILWLPDVFGYSGALPQIMAKCGIDYFMTTKLAWNQFNKMPYDTFRWRGIDGTEILTHLVTTLGVGQSETDFFTTYNGILHPDAILGGWHRYQQKDINNDILISYGYGDGGGGPTREMLETSARMAKGIEGIPRVRQAFARTYFDELDARVRNNPRLPVWEGELYFEYHRGTLTSMARNKRSNRRAELHMMDLELFSVLASGQLDYPKESIDRLWRGILLNQFHDILPGSAIHEVYEVTKQEYEQMEAEIAAMQAPRMQALVPAGKGITVFNTTGFFRSDVVNLGRCTAAALRDETGRTYPVQQTENGAVAFVESLPPKGYRTFAPAEEAPTPTLFRISGEGRCLETPFYTVVFDENGRMTSLFDRANIREVLKEGQPGNLMRVYEDKPIYYDNWDIDIFYTEKFWDVTDLREFRWTETGAVRATLHLVWEFSNSTLVQDIHFYADMRRIDFETTVDWKEHQHLLKVHFPVNVHTDEATFEIQYGNLTRKTHTNTSWDRARFESCGQKWMDLSEGHYGVSLLNDCKYGHSVKDSVIGLTLIKSGIEPNPTTDQEVHHFTYALYPHAERWQSAETVPQAFFLNQPAISAAGGQPGSCFSLGGTNLPNVVMETVKQAEDGNGTIVRLYECENALTRVSLNWNLPFKIAESCNCLEQPDGESIEVENGRMTFLIKPYEIKTIRII